MFEAFPKNNTEIVINPDMRLMIIGRRKEIVKFLNFVGNESTLKKIVTHETKKQNACSRTAARSGKCFKN